MYKALAPELSTQKNPSMSPNYVCIPQTHRDIPDTELVSNRSSSLWPDSLGKPPGDPQVGSSPLSLLLSAPNVPMKAKPFQMSLALVLVFVLTPWSLSL